jgi:hypothetical protein
MKTANIATTTLREKAVVVWLHTNVDPLPEEWKAGIDITVALMRKNGIENMRSFVVSDGGAPNSAQRRQLAEAFGGRPHKLVVVTNSLTNPVKRGVATAISWINPAFKAVGPAMWHDALRHVDLEGELDALLLVLRRLQEDLPSVATLVELERSSATVAALLRD